MVRTSPARRRNQMKTPVLGQAEGPVERWMGNYTRGSEGYVNDSSHEGPSAFVSSVQ
jgi:hypothetical protein